MAFRGRIGRMMKMKARRKVVKMVKDSNHGLNEDFLLEDDNKKVAAGPMSKHRRASQVFARMVNPKTLIIQADMIERAHSPNRKIKSPVVPSSLMASMTKSEMSKALIHQIEESVSGMKSHDMLEWDRKERDEELGLMQEMLIYGKNMAVNTRTDVITSQTERKRNLYEHVSKMVF